MWEVPSGGCRAGLDLERCSQLAVFAIQSVGWVPAAVSWLVDDGVPRCAPLPSPNMVPFGRWRHARSREHCRGEPDRALLGGYAPDSTRVKVTSIVDDPGECWTAVRDNQRRKSGGFWGKNWSLTRVCFVFRKLRSAACLSHVHSKTPTAGVVYGLHGGLGL